MKNVIKFLGIIALAAVIGFGMVSFGDGGDDGKTWVDPLDSLPTAERWWAYYHNDSTTTITHEVDSEVMCQFAKKIAKKCI